MRYADASPTIGTTEYSFAAESTTLPTKTDIGIYYLTMDANAVIAGDSFLVQVYESGITAGTKRLLTSWPIDGKQGQPVGQPIGLLLGNGWDWTILKVSGTDRAFPFTLWQVT